MPQFAVRADVVMGNQFLYKNESKTITVGGYYGKRFYVNSPSGCIIAKEEPGSEKGISTQGSYVQMPEDVYKFLNGEIICIEKAYLDNGEYWGVMPASHAYQPPGWFPMNELLMLYEREDFEKENQDKFYEYTGNFDAVSASKRLILWEWPGSDRSKIILESEKFSNEDIKALRAYKDKEGREWVYVKIKYRESWICLTEPDNSNIPAFNPAPKPIKWSPEGTYEWTHTNTIDDTVLHYSLSNLTKDRTYEQNKIFTDVSDTAWYKNAVMTAYEYGIIDGKGNNEFDPDGQLSAGEALTIASRIHAYYKYGKEKGFKLLSEYNDKYRSHFTGWDGVGKYCIVEGLISSDEYNEDKDIYYYLRSPITRAQMVHAWAKILEPKDMAKQNTVVNLPDVSVDTDYSADIFLFYETGLTGGVDGQGTFLPNSNVTRAEAATIFMNIIDLNKRQNGRTYGYSH